MIELMNSVLLNSISGCFAGLGYLSLYLAGKLSLFDRRGYTSRVFFVLVPHLAAVLIGISRVNDYQHRWIDIIGAAIIGKNSECLHSSLMNVYVGGSNINLLIIVY